MIFVDTGGWVGYISPDDEYHTQANNWIRANRQNLLTTYYIVDESLTLLKVRGEVARARQLGSLLFGDVRGIGPSSKGSSGTASGVTRGRGSRRSGNAVQLYYLTSEDILAAWQVFRHYDDKEWSFTDCTSKVVIEKLGLTRAFSFDHHFRQFGTVSVVP